MDSSIGAPPESLLKPNAPLPLGPIDTFDSPSGPLIEAMDAADAAGAAMQASLSRFPEHRSQYDVLKPKSDRERRSPSGTSSFDEYIEQRINRPFPSLNEGSSKDQPALNQTAAMGSDFAAYKALGGIGGATQDSLIPKADRDAIIKETTSLFDRAKVYITESAKQFGEGIIEGGKNSAGVIQYSTKLNADAITNGAKMTDEEFRVLERRELLGLD